MLLFVVVVVVADPDSGISMALHADAAAGPNLTSANALKGTDATVHSSNQAFAVGPAAGGAELVR